jgi:hypothetical protein
LLIVHGTPETAKRAAAVIENTRDDSFLLPTEAGALLQAMKV